MKISIFGLVLAVFLLSNKVYADSPLQFEPQPLFPEHSHGHGPNGALEISAKARLPHNVLPSRYHLKIRPILDDVVPDIDKWTAPGTVEITVTCHEATNTVTLHAAQELAVNNPIVVKNVNDENDAFVATFTRDEPNQLLFINLDKDLAVDGVYTIEIPFVAPVGDPEAVPPVLNGLYRSSYQKLDGTTSYLATTQLEAIAARQMFPCFDEPWMKATVKMTIGYLENKYDALSNGDLIASEKEPITDPGSEGWVYQGFEETVPMSTYLIAIIIAEYSFAEAAPELYDKPVRTYGPTHLIERGGGAYSANMAARILAFLEEKYTIEYKLSKLDSVAVKDFSFGAMENWGLNIYREAYLLYHEGESSEENRNLITIILAHELAHQWFGNLVTCQFWDQIYLNEGFATYNEFLAADAVAPEFDSMKIQVQDAVQRAMAFDATAATHPIINAANGDDHTATIMAFFDRITYQKGGSVIRMMEGFLGEETFNRALIEYLTKKSFEGAHQNELFEVLTERAHDEGKIPMDITMKDIMDTWTLQSGFPVVSVSKADNSRIYVSQTRFSSNAAFANEELEPNDLWEIPVAIASADAPDFANHTAALWLQKKVALRTHNIDTTKWLVVNPEATGYFRVLYDYPLLQLILQQYAANLNVISPMSRSQLFDDYYTFATSNYISVETALEFTKYLGGENELVVWKTVFTHLRPVFNRLSGTAAFDEFRQYFGPKLVGALTLIGLEQLPEHKGANVILRIQLLDWACAMDRPECLDYATKLFVEWDALPEGDIAKVPVDIRQIIFCGAVSQGGADAFNKVKDRYVLSSTPAQFVSLYLNALGCAQEPAILASLLDEIFDTDSILRSVEDRIIVLQRLAANSHSRAALISFLREHANMLIIALQPSSISRVVQTLSTYVGTDAELDSINTLIAENEAALAGVMASLRASVSAIEANVAWRKANENRLHAWFQVSKM